MTDKVMKDGKILSHAMRGKLSRPTQYSILYNTKKESDAAWTCPKNVTQQLAREIAAVATRKGGKRTVTRRNGREKTGRTRVDGLEQLTAIIRRSTNRQTHTHTHTYIAAGIT